VIHAELLRAADGLVDVTKKNSSCLEWDISIAIATQDIRQFVIQ